MSSVSSPPALPVRMFSDTRLIPRPMFVPFQTHPSVVCTQMLPLSCALWPLACTAPFHSVRSTPQYRHFQLYAESTHSLAICSLSVQTPAIFTPLKPLSPQILSCFQSLARSCPAHATRTIFCFLCVGLVHILQGLKIALRKLGMQEQTSLDVRCN